MPSQVEEREKTSRLLPANLAAPGPPRSAADSESAGQGRRGARAVLGSVTEQSGETFSAWVSH